jgi:Zn-dependent protease/CBS domain-containing protein
MFGRKLRLFTLLGFSVSVDTSWIFLAILIIWTLSLGYFPQVVPGLSPEIYWVMGTLGAFGLFFSIVFHEFSHSIVARKKGLAMNGITLFLFGGVAEMSEEPPNPGAEFWMAIAGPIASVVLGIGFLAIGGLGQNQGWPLAVNSVFLYLGFINILLAVFNMIPGFPLDGGRVLRSILWKIKGDIRWATKWAMRSGSFVGFALIALAVFAFLAGQFVAAVWWFLIGMFLRMAAQGSYIQLEMRETLKGESVARFMKPAPEAVSAEIPVSEFVDDYIYRYQNQVFPVVNSGHLLGKVGIEQARNIPKERRSWVRVREIMQEVKEEEKVTTETDAFDAIQKMNQERQSEVFVTSLDGELEGLVKADDILSFFKTRMALEQSNGGPSKPSTKSDSTKKAG